MDYFNEISQFHFIRPFWLFALLPSLGLIWLLLRNKDNAALWGQVISPELLPHLLVGQATQRRQFPFYLLALLWFIAIFALAGPTWQQLPQPVQKKINAQVIVLDLSRSMFADDLKPSRLVRARHKVMDILHRSREGVTGLVVYSGDAHVVSPLTDDTATISSLVPALNPLLMPIQGSNLNKALLAATSLLKNGGAQQGQIILVTDGIESSEVDSAEALIKNTAYRLAILGVGTEKGAPITLPDGSLFKDSQGAIVVPQLKRPRLINLSSQLNGLYSDIKNNDADLDIILSSPLSFAKDEYKSSERIFDLWKEEGPWLLLLILPLASAGFRRGWLGILVMSLIPILSFTPSPAQASIWNDLWHTQDQQASEQYRNQNYEAAAERFKSKKWKASSYYQQGNFDEAQKYFAEPETADDFYNQANALAKANKLEEALASYQQAEALNPDDSDTQFNYELVKKLLEQQQQDENKQNEGDEKQDGEKNNKKDGDKNENPSENGDKSDEQGNDSENQDDSSPPDSQSDEKGKSEPSPENKNKTEEQADAQQDDPEEGTDDSEEAAQQTVPSELSDLSEQEKQQALEQWLRRVPDEPGGLLRRKFSLKSRQQQSETPDKQW